MVGGLAELPGVEVVPLAPFKIRVRATARPDLYVRLDGMAKAHRHGELPVAAAIAEIALAAGAPGAQELATQVGVERTEPAGPFPKLMRRGALPDLPPQTMLRPCVFDHELVIGYVRTLPHGQIPVTLPEVAQGWPAVDDLHAEALRHLRAATRGIELQGVGSGAEVAMGFATGDGHDAARALLPEVLAEASDWLPGGLLVGIPCRDLLLLIGDADPRFVEEARAHVADVFRTYAQPISPHLYRLVDGPALERLVS